MADKKDKTTETNKMDETFGGYVLHNVPFPVELDESALDQLKGMSPILIEQPYNITYLHSFGQDSPFFAGLANGHLLVKGFALSLKKLSFACPVRMIRKMVIGLGMGHQPENSPCGITNTCNILHGTVWVQRE